METRIPVSLKFETEDELYYSLIEPMRANKKLSPFIVSLLSAYFKNEQIRELIDEFISTNDSVERIRSHIQRIAELQGKNVRLIEDYEQSVGAVSNGETVSSGGNAELKDVVERLTTLENTVYQIVDTMSIKPSDKSGGIGSVSGNFNRQPAIIPESVTNNDRLSESGVIDSVNNEKSVSAEKLSQNTVNTENSGLNGSTAVENQNSVVYGGNNKNGLQGDSGGVTANSNSVVAVVENGNNTVVKNGVKEEETEAEDLLGSFMDSLF